jgi:hypothetical protein
MIKVTTHNEFTSRSLISERNQAHNFKGFRREVERQQTTSLAMTFQRLLETSSMLLATLQTKNSFSG